MCYIFYSFILGEVLIAEFYTYKNEWRLSNFLSNFTCIKIFQAKFLLAETLELVRGPFDYKYLEVKF